MRESEGEDQSVSLTQSPAGTGEITAKVLFIYLVAMMFFFAIWSLEENKTIKMIAAGLLPPSF